MSSPTINISQGTDNSLEAIMNLVRALVNDSQAGATATPGEGQILTDNPAISPFTQPFLNSSIREVYRELRNVGAPTLIKDNVIVSNLPVVNSPTNGQGIPDPSVQVYLSKQGFFDGVEMWPNFLLPDDIIAPVMLWERQTGTNDTFKPMSQSQFGLPSRPQLQTLSEWEWRNDNINFVGSTQNRDIRIRYYCQLPRFFSQTLDFSQTFLPLLDGVDAVAYKTAAKYAAMLGAPGADYLEKKAAEQMFQLKQEYVRRAQSVEYYRIPYGSQGNVTGSLYNDGQ